MIAVWVVQDLYFEGAFGGICVQHAGGLPPPRVCEPDERNVPRAVYRANVAHSDDVRAVLGGGLRGRTRPGEPVRGNRHNVALAAVGVAIIATDFRVTEGHADPAFASWLGLERSIGSPLH